MNTGSPFPHPVNSLGRPFCVGHCLQLLKNRDCMLMHLAAERIWRPWDKKSEMRSHESKAAEDKGIILFYEAP